MIFSSLSKAIEARANATGKSDYDVFKDDSIFGRIAFELMQSIDDWALNGFPLLDSSNWNHGRLLLENGTYRKPKIFVRTLVTSKCNLVLEWFPEPPNSNTDIGLNDFPTFSESTFGSGVPYNRLVMIREFQSLLRISLRNPTSAETDLVEAVRKHFQNVFDTLNVIFDVTGNCKIQLMEMNL